MLYPCCVNINVASRCSSHNHLVPGLSWQMCCCLVPHWSCSFSSCNLQTVFLHLYLYLVWHCSEYSGHAKCLNITFPFDCFVPAVQLLLQLIQVTWVLTSLRRLSMGNYLSISLITSFFFSSFLQLAVLNLWNNFDHMKIEKIIQIRLQKTNLKLMDRSASNWNAMIF